MPLWSNSLLMPKKVNIGRCFFFTCVSFHEFQYIYSWRGWNSVISHFIWYYRSSIAIILITWYHYMSKFHKEWLLCQKICLLKHEIALYTESTEAVCGSQIALHPFCYTYILLHIRQLLSHYTLIITLCILFMYFIKCILCLNPCFMCFCTFQSC